MEKPKFVYATYIRTTPKKLWQALTDPAFTRQWWFGTYFKTDWKPGSPWELIYPDGTITDTGEILEATPPRRLVLKWRNEFRPELKAEGYSRCTIEIEKTRGSAKLTVIHAMEGKGTKFIAAVSDGWPKILSNIKSLLETGEPLAKQKL
ncbi:MAG TPA: SRPBCC family protein [Pseudomonadales bacterium]|nr:SRPBCC family protein [Pseudomonadales bacterium]